MKEDQEIKKALAGALLEAVTACDMAVYALSSAKKAARFLTEAMNSLGIDGVERIRTLVSADLYLAAREEAGRLLARYTEGRDG